MLEVCAIYNLFIVIEFFGYKSFANHRIKSLVDQNLFKSCDQSFIRWQKDYRMLAIFGICLWFDNVWILTSLMCLFIHYFKITCMPAEVMTSVWVLVEFEPQFAFIDQWVVSAGNPPTAMNVYRSHYRGIHLGCPHELLNVLCFGSSSLCRVQLPSGYSQRSMVCHKIKTHRQRWMFTKDTRNGRTALCLGRSFKLTQ